jgi:cellulose synthase/poly-beta-1,6-N-acetylglucosamine synthase-like glycosyltransferase
MFLQTIFFVLSLILTLLFFLYGFNHYYLLYKASQYQHPILKEYQDTRPFVSIQLPIFNEKYVVNRLISACIRMAETYGKDRVDILILDDSDDDTISEVDSIVQEYKIKNFHIDVFRRTSRVGFKAGALQAGLEKTSEDFIAIFDADFIPPADFLVRTVPYLIQNDQLGIVQSRWSHLNREFNILTKAIAIAIDIHFIIEQSGRYAAGLLQNFNGSAGVIRKKAILDSGGWQSDTLAEDLDLSYRMQLQGYRVLYLMDLVCPGEIPPTVPSFKKQQGRWACGSLRTARKILPILLSEPKFGYKQRLQAFIHLTGYMIFPLITFSFLLNCLATFVNLKSNLGSHAAALYLSRGILDSTTIIQMLSLQNVIWIILGILIVLCTIAPWVSSITTLRVQKVPLFRNLGSLLVLLLLGFGTSISNSLEAARGLFSDRKWEFSRTPKYAELESREGWKARKYQIDLDPVWILELSFACMGIVAIGIAIRNSNYFAISILIPFTAAYLFIFVMTIRQSQRPKA